MAGADPNTDTTARRAVDVGPDRPADLDRAAAAARTIAYLERCRRRIVDLAGRLDHRPAADGADALGRALDRAIAAPPIPGRPSWLPVLDTVETLVDDDGPLPRGSDLTAELVALSPSLTWVPTPRADDNGAKLALAPFDHLLDLGDTTVGLMYVGPWATYPLHRHPPQELYLTIAGHGRWRYGGLDDVEPVGFDRLLYNHPGDLHTASAGPSPLVALYVLW